MTTLQFRVLYRQFLFRMVDLELLSPQGDMSKLLGQFAALLIFLSIGFAMRLVAIDGRMPREALLISVWGTEHSMIAATMLVVGLFAVLSWDSTFPDRRDVLVLGPLPVRTHAFSGQGVCVGHCTEPHGASLEWSHGLSFSAGIGSPEFQSSGLDSVTSSISLIRSVLDHYDGGRCVHLLFRSRRPRIGRATAAAPAIPAIVSLSTNDCLLPAPQCVLSSAVARDAASSHCTGESTLAGMAAVILVSGAFSAAERIYAPGNGSIGAPSVGWPHHCRFWNGCCVRAVLFPHSPEDH